MGRSVDVEDLVGAAEIAICGSVWGVDDDDDVLELSDEELLALPRPPCPQCGVSGGLIPRIYGMPAGDDPLVQRAERGEVDVEFAGCVIPVDALPIWRCRRCDGLVAEDGSLIEEVRYE